MFTELPSDCIMVIMEFIFYKPKRKRCIAETANGKMCTRKKKICLFCKQHYIRIINDNTAYHVLLRTIIKRSKQEKNLKSYKNNLYRAYKRYNDDKLIDIGDRYIFPFYNL